MLGKGPHLSKWFRKLREIRLPRFQLKPSKTTITFVIIAIVIIILGGGVYDLLEWPPLLVPFVNYPYWFIPGMTDQSLSESLVFIFFLTLGVVGGLLIFRSTRYAYRPREAKLILAIGITLLLAGFIGSEYQLLRVISP